MRINLTDDWFVLANAEGATVEEIDAHLARIATPDEVPDFFVDFVVGAFLPRRETHPRIRNEHGEQQRDPVTNRPLRGFNQNHHAEVAQDRNTARALIQSWKVKAGAERARLAPIRAGKL
jgi:hypothetical protein